MAIHFMKAAAAGFFLIIGCCSLLSAGNFLAGTLLFAVALCAICSLELPLYTGAAGFARSLDDFKMLGISLLGNMAGCAVLGLLVSIALPEMSPGAAGLVLRKVYPLHTGFILSFVCGILMYAAVYIYRIRKSYIGIFICVPAFIVCGFEHSIAYMGFMALGQTATFDVIVNMLVFVAGNGIGAVILGFIVNAGRGKG